jgi:hypothetical protein
VGKVSGDQGGVAWGGPQGALEEPGRHAGVTPRRGGRRAEGLDGPTPCGKAGPGCGGTESALDPGATPGGGREGTWGWIPPGGGKEPERGTGSCPGGASQRAGIGGQGDGPVCGALAAGALDLEALAIAVGTLQGAGGRESEAQTRDGGEGDRVGPGSGRHEEPPDLLHPEDSGETVGGGRAEAGAGVPVAREDVRREDADAARAEAHGRWGEAVDVLPRQEGRLQGLCREAVGGWMGERRQPAYGTDIGLLGPLSLPTQVQCRKHLLTEWSHAMSPCFS